MYYGLCFLITKTKLRTMNFMKHFGHGDSPSMTSAPERDFNISQNERKPGVAGPLLVLCWIIPQVKSKLFNITKLALT